MCSDMLGMVMVMGISNVTKHGAYECLHDRFANQTESTMADGESFLQAFFLHTRSTRVLVNHSLVQPNGLFDNGTRWIHLPSPFCANGVFVVAPTECALVCTCQRRSGLHALIGCNAVASVLVATSSTTQLVLRPAAQLHCGVCADDFVTLFR